MTDTTHEHHVGDLVIAEAEPDCWLVRTAAGLVLATVPLHEFAEQLADDLADERDWSEVTKLSPDLAKIIQNANLNVFKGAATELMEQGKTIRSADHAEALERKIRLLDAWNDNQGNRAERRRFAKLKKNALRRL